MPSPGAGTGFFIKPPQAPRPADPVAQAPVEKVSFHADPNGGTRREFIDITPEELERRTRVSDQDIEAGRRLRDEVAQQYRAYKPGTAPQAAGAQISPTRGYDAPSVGLVERVDAGRISAAQIDPIREAYANQVGAAQIDPIERAEAERIQAERVGAVDPVTGQRIDTGSQDQVRARQMDLLSMLEAAAAGRGGPSAAELMLQRAAERNAAQQFGMAQAARGQSAGSALRQAMMGAANVNAQASADAAILRAQEQDQARKTLTGALEATRGADIGIATQQAQLLQQAGLQNQQTALARTLEQARLGQAANTANQEAMLRAGLANQQAYNTRAFQQAQLGQQSDLANQEAMLRASLANQSAYNTRALQQAQLSQQADVANQDADMRAMLANQSAYNASRLQQAQLDARAAEFGADAYNRAALEQARLDQSSNQFNVEAALRQAALDEQRRASLQQGAMMTTGSLVDYAARLEAIRAGKPDEPGWWDKYGGFLFTAGGAIAGGVAGGPGGAVAGANIGAAAGSQI